MRGGEANVCQVYVVNEKTGLKRYRKVSAALLAIGAVVALAHVG